MFKSDAQERPRTDPVAEVAETKWSDADVKRLHAQADEIESRLPASEDELELLRCLHRRRADGRLLRVRKIARLLDRTSDEIHDLLATLQRKGFVSRPSVETGTFRLEVLAAGG